MNAPHTVDLWIADTTAAPRDVSILSDEERADLCQFQDSLARQQFLASRVLLRHALSRSVFGDIAPFRWRFHRETGGKPCVDPLAGLPLLHFNLSHSGRMAAVAVSSSCPVGLDVEPINRLLRVIPANVVLTTREHVLMKAQLEEDRIEYFLKIWTIKEAYAKLLGDGMAIDFTSIEAMIHPAKVIPLRGISAPKHLVLDQRMLEFSGEVYSLCLAAMHTASRHLTIRMNFLKN